MAAYTSSLADMNDLFAKWRKIIFDELGQHGRLADFTHHFLENNPQLVTRFQKRYYLLTRTGNIDDFVREFIQQNSENQYIHGVSRDLHVHIDALVKYRHFDLLDQIKWLDVRKILAYVKHGVNDRVDLKNIDPDLYPEMMQIAMGYNNVEVAENLHLLHGIAVIPDNKTLCSVASSNNPNFLDYLEENRPLTDDQCYDLLRLSTEYDSDKMVEKLIHRYIASFDEDGNVHQLLAKFEIFSLSLHCNATKVLALLMRLYPDVKIVDVFENRDEPYPPSLHKIIISGSAEMNRLIAENMAKFS